MDADLTVVDNEAAGRFEVAVDGELAVAEYERDGDTIVFTHTLVPRSIRRRGVGSALAAAALDRAKARSLTVVPVCPFIAHYVREHPEYAPLVRPEPGR